MPNPAEEAGLLLLMCCGGRLGCGVCGGRCGLRAAQTARNCLRHRQAGRFAALACGRLPRSSVSALAWAQGPRSELAENRCLSSRSAQADSHRTLSPDRQRLAGCRAETSRAGQIARDIVLRRKRWLRGHREHWVAGLSTQVSPSCPRRTLRFGGSGAADENAKVWSEKNVGVVPRREAGFDCAVIDGHHQAGRFARGHT